MSELQAIGPALLQFVDAPDPEPRKHAGGRPPCGDRPMTRKERNRKTADKNSSDRKRCIAVLDFETDPFDNGMEFRAGQWIQIREPETVMPFTACLYSDQFEPVIIWECDHDKLVNAVVAAIEALPEPYTIYAHNGGKFDYLFLIHKIRGNVSFKGRGIMSCKIGDHELRDSFHIIPERLANIQKDHFDYNNMRVANRNSYRAEIIRYMINDCIYLFDIVKAFVVEFGLKLSIGQAAMMKIREHYKVKRFTENWDGYVRDYYFGGRVECLRGAGKFTGAYKLYDVNSMYPDVMARYQHPIGAFHDYVLRTGIPGNDTCFIDLDCDNRGALVARDDNGTTTANIPHGRFRTTVWEYEIACKYNLISNVQINFCLDCSERSTFADFVHPLYERRQVVKADLSALKAQGVAGAALVELNRWDIFLKLLLNNGYGKFAQNPRNFKEHYLTDPGQMPPDQWFQSIALLSARLSKTEYKAVTCWHDAATLFPELHIHLQPHFEGARYWIWQKPCPRFTYNNVGTAASITGAARATLLEALQHSKDAIYCDTDSIICRELAGVRLHKTELGAWDLEDEFSEVIIDGKKLYSVQHATPKKRSADDLVRGLVPEYTVKSKGTSQLTWQQMEAMLNGDEFVIPNRAPTLTRYGTQTYIKRRIRATATAE